MANPGGGNQFGSYELQAPYGDVARQTALVKESPISGSPLAAQALQAPRRAQKAATRQGRTQANRGVNPAQVTPPAPSQQFTVAAAWQSIASLPGASPLVQQMAQVASGQS